MNTPFIQIDIGEHDSYKEPYAPAGFVGSKELFDKYMEEHERENRTKIRGNSKNKFPFCCKFHKFIFDDVKKGFDNFPRERDKKYLNNPWFKKSNYAILPRKITAQILLTQYHIEKTISSTDWYNDITEYIDYNIDCLGYPAVFWDYYIHYLKFLLQNLAGTEKEKEAYKKLLAYVEENYCTPKETVEPTDLNELYATYEKWLAAFPFNISYFVDLKNGFEKGFFTILLNKQRSNRYTGMYSAKARTQTELIEVLTNTTKELLYKIDAFDLLEKGLIPDTKQHTLELKKKDLKIKNELLLGKFSTGEIEYLNILKEWLTDQKDFFRDIEQFFVVKSEQKNEDDTTDNLKAKVIRSEFEKLGFGALAKIKGVSENSVRAIFDLLATNKTPYRIALLDYLGFIELLYQSKSKESVYNLLAELFGAKARVIKGNCLVLSAQSEENRNTYTSHLHKKEVEKDYQNIKLG